MLDNRCSSSLHKPNQVSIKTLAHLSSKASSHKRRNSHLSHPSQCSQWEHLIKSQPVQLSEVIKAPIRIFHREIQVKSVSHISLEIQRCLDITSTSLIWVGAFKGT